MTRYLNTNIFKRGAYIKFISKVIASEDKEGAVNILMQAYKASSFQIISINEIELESGMMFDIH